MLRLGGRSAAAVALFASVLGTSACGGSGRAPGSSSAITYLMGTRPGSLDPAVADTTEALEPDTLAYTPLLTYARARGLGGTQPIAGLATALPVITDGGKTYTFTLRNGLVYSDGEPVQAGDFKWAVERAIKLRWRGSRRFILGRISGASAFASGKAKTISGITTDDATGQITIHLTAAFGPFDNVLALPALGLVPTGTPFRNESTTPPPGAGPYVISNVVPGVSFSMVKNPEWPKIDIPGIPSGHINIDVKISSNVYANALAVLNGAADVFDWTDAIPPRLVARIKSDASDRYTRQVINATDLIFMNATRRPFSSQLAREAVLVGLDEKTIGRLGAGTLEPGCYFLPPSIFGHPSAPCPYGRPSAGGNLARAKALVKASGMAGAPVTVRSAARGPARRWMNYYTSLLDSIGFKASERVIGNASYYATIGSPGLDPQTGFASVDEALPDPVEYYGLLAAGAIRPSSDLDWGEVHDRYIDAQVRTLAAVPAAQLGAVASVWSALDRYTAGKAYFAVLGYEYVPDFVSSRIDYWAVVFDPEVGFAWSSFRLK